MKPIPNNHPHKHVEAYYDHHAFQDFIDRMDKALDLIKPDQVVTKRYIYETVKFLPWRDQ